MSSFKIIGKNIDIKEHYGKDAAVQECYTDFELERKLVCCYNDSNSFVNVPSYIYQSLPYLDWCGTAEFKIFTALAGSIIRAPMKSQLARAIHEQCYKKGLLVARYSTRALATKLGKPKHYQATVTRNIKSLVDKGFIHKIAVKWYNDVIYLYEMGVYDMAKKGNEIKKIETLHAYSQINEIIGKTESKKFYSIEG